MQKILRKFSLLTIAVLMLNLIAFGASVAKAEESGASTAGSVNTTTIKPVPVKIRTEARENSKQTIQNVRAEIKDIRQNASTTRVEAREEIKNKIEQGKTEIKNIRETAKEQVREKLNELKQNRIKREVAMTVKRFDAAVERLQKLAERIKTRIEKLAAGGLNMDGPKAKLADALLKIRAAQTAVDEIASVNVDLTVNSTASSTNPGLGNLMALRTAVEKAKASIKAAHGALVDVVISIKPTAEKFERENHATTTSGSNEASD